MTAAQCQQVGAVMATISALRPPRGKADACVDVLREIVRKADLWGFSSPELEAARAALRALGDD